MGKIKAGYLPLYIKLYDDSVGLSYREPMERYMALCVKMLEEEGVEVVYLPRTPEISTSQIKKDLYDANAVDGKSKTSHDEINTDPGK